MSNSYQDKLEGVIKDRVLVCIDAANLERSVQSMWVNPKDIPDELHKYSADQLCWRVDYKKLKSFFEDISDLKMVRFYSAHFGTDNHNKFFWFLNKKLKYKLKTKPLKQYGDHSKEAPHRKANFDVEIAVDATYLLDGYDTFILFSGDCDFEYLLKFLRGQGKRVIVFSKAGHVAKELPPASNYYFDIVDFRGEILRVAEKQAKNPT